MTNILIVDGEIAIAAGIARVLVVAGFRVRTVSTGSAALLDVALQRPDLIILELVLPDMRGEDVLTELIAANPGQRVIALTAETNIATVVAVLDGGAVDYIAKPFANTELIARVRARTRDISKPLTGTDDCTGTEIQLDYRRRLAMICGRGVSLTSKEFLLLSYMIQRAPDPCSPNELLAAVWGKVSHSHGSENMLQVHISRLRLKLMPAKIEMVRHVGYRLVIG